jgi:gluconokinase
VDHVLTIDIGTTSSKALLVSRNGEVVYSSQVFYPTNFPKPGRSEQDASVILDAVNKLIKDCAVAHSELIGTISLSAAMHSILAVDRKGSPLSPVMIWSDMRSTAIAKTLRASPAGARLHEETGTPVHPMSPLCKLLWIRENEGRLFKEAARFVSIKEFVVWHWCAEWVVDYSIASASGLFDIRKLRWSDEALALADLQPARLSLCASPYLCVPLTREVSSSFGLPNSLPVTLGASDGCLAHLGSNALGAGDLSLTIGTSGAVRKMSDKVAIDPAHRLFNYRLDEKWFITGGAANNGTAAIDWFKKNFCNTPDMGLEDFVKSAHHVNAGADGLLFLPYVFGERSPYYNPDLRAMFFGLAQHHSMEHMKQSVLEGICFAMRIIVEAVAETLPPVKRVIASGGFIRSALWVQMFADVLNREIVVNEINDASSMGAALMGFRTLKHDAGHWKHGLGTTYNPRRQNRETYDTLYSIFGRMGAQLPEEFGEIASLQRGR